MKLKLLLEGFEAPAQGVDVDVPKNQGGMGNIFNSFLVLSQSRKILTKQSPSTQIEDNLDF